MEEKKKQKGAWMHSMRTQFVTVVLVVATIIVVLYTLLIMPQVKNNIRNIYSNYLLDLSLSYGKELDEVIKETDPNLLNNPDKLKEILQDVGLEEADSAYAYLVAHDGTMLYHPTPEKIGQPVENDAVKKMVLSSWLRRMIRNYWHLLRRLNCRVQEFLFYFWSSEGYWLLLLSLASRNPLWASPTA